MHCAQQLAALRDHHQCDPWVYAAQQLDLVAAMEDNVYKKTNHAYKFDNAYDVAHSKNLNDAEKAARDQLPSPSRKW